MLLKCTSHNCDPLITCYSLWMCFVCALVGLEDFNKENKLHGDFRRTVISQPLCFDGLLFVQDNI